MSAAQALERRIKSIGRAPLRRSDVAQYYLDPTSLQNHWNKNHILHTVGVQVAAQHALEQADVRLGSCWVKRLGVPALLCTLCRDFLLVFRRDLFEAWTPTVVAVPIQCTRLGHLSVFLHIPSDHEQPPVSSSPDRHIECSPLLLLWDPKWMLVFGS